MYVLQHQLSSALWEVSELRKKLGIEAPPAPSGGKSADSWKLPETGSLPLPAPTLPTPLLGPVTPASGDSSGSDAVDDPATVKCSFEGPASSESGSGTSGSQQDIKLELVEHPALAASTKPTTLPPPCPAPTPNPQGADSIPQQMNQYMAAQQQWYMAYM